MTILTFVACQNNKTENHLTKLEKLINETDILNYNSKTFDQIIIEFQSKKPELKRDEVTFVNENKNEPQLQEHLFRYYYDRIDNNINRFHTIRITEFATNRQAGQAFQETIEFQACCIPDEDIVKLKNFENLDYFKNSASITLLTDNIVIKIQLDNQTKDRQEISNLLDEILNGRKYLKLEIGNGGPAIWTRK